MGDHDEKLEENETREGDLSKVVGAMCADFRLLLGQFREFAVADRGKLIASVALLVTGIALSFLFAFAFARPADQEVATQGVGVVGWAVGRDAKEVVLFLSLAALLLVTCKYLERLWMVQIGERATASLSKKVFAQIVAQPMAFFAGSQARGIDAKVVDDISRVRRAWTHDLLSVLRSFLLVLVTSVLMFVVAPELARPVSGMVLILGVAWAISVWLLTKKGLVTHRESDWLGRSPAIKEAIDGMATVKAFGNETLERTRFRHRVEILLGSAMRSAGKRRAMLAVGSLALFGIAIYTCWLGAGYVSDGRFLADEFTVFVILLIIAGAALRKLAKKMCRLITASRASKRLDTLFAESVERLDSGKFMPDSRQRLDGRLNISKASFAYPDAPDHWVIDSLSLAVLPGGKIAIAGPPGSGKTALVHLILGYYPLESGSVEVDGRPLGDYPLSWLRSQIGWVPAETCLFSGTVGDNIGYGRANATAAEIREAAEKAGALAFIESLPDTFDTALAFDAGSGSFASSSEIGLHLSAEQKRRIALARVFLEDPPIVFIDAPASGIIEATVGNGRSAGDTNRSLSMVEEALIKDRTAIVVATRMTTTRTMDKILVLRDGKVAERGSHKELYEGRGFYRLLCEGQFGKD